MTAPSVCIVSSEGGAGGMAVVISSGGVCEEAPSSSLRTLRGLIHHGGGFIEWQGLPTAGVIRGLSEVFGVGRSCIVARVKGVYRAVVLVRRIHVGQSVSSGHPSSIQQQLAGVTGTPGILLETVITGDCSVVLVTRRFSGQSQPSGHPDPPLTQQQLTGVVVTGRGVVEAVVTGYWGVVLVLRSQSGHCAPSGHPEPPSVQQQPLGAVTTD